MSNDASVEALFADVTAREGAPAILVNNAGITRDNLLMRMTPDEWDAVVSTNLVVRLPGVEGVRSRHDEGALRPHINIGSVVGMSGNAGQTNYAAAKAGIVGFTKSLAREIASRNVTVNVIAPGFIDTDMTRALDEKQVQALCEQIPLARLGSTADIAAAVVFLASDRGRLHHRRNVQRQRRNVHALTAGADRKPLIVQSFAAFRAGRGGPNSG